jgi:hypothetical protein
MAKESCVTPRTTDVSPPIVVFVTYTGTATPRSPSELKGPSRGPEIDVGSVVWTFELNNRGRHPSKHKVRVEIAVGRSGKSKRTRSHWNRLIEVTGDDIRGNARWKILGIHSVIAGKSIPCVARDVTLAKYSHLGRSIHKILMEDQGIQTEPRRTVKIGRNDPCPCGSGRKFK